MMIVDSFKQASQKAENFAQKKTTAGSGNYCGNAFE